METHTISTDWNLCKYSNTDFIEFFTQILILLSLYFVEFFFVSVIYEIVYKYLKSAALKCLLLYDGTFYVILCSSVRGKWFIFFIYCFC